MADLVLTNITKSYGKNRVLKNLSLTIKDGEFVTLLGPSGCGKTTLLRIIAGLETHDGGSLTIGGVDMKGLPPQKRPISMVFQSYALFPHMNVRNNIIFGLRIQKMREHEIFEKLDWVMPLLGLGGLEDRLPKEISGGQRQRVALARALVLDPDVLLLDEPLSNLDAALRENAMVELKRIHSKVGKTIIYVSHNQAEAMSMSERIAVFDKGEVEQYAEPRVLYDNPQTLFTAGFIGSPSANRIEGKIRGGANPYFETTFAKIALGSAYENSECHAVSSCLRPQDLYVVEDAADALFSVTVEMIETPGDRNLVVGSTSSDEHIYFFMGRNEKISIGDTLHLTMAQEHMHLFSSVTEERLPLTSENHEVHND